MQFTEEQQDIIDSTGNIRINAVAGSGKTTTLIAYAASRPAHARILYIAFNKSVKTEAQTKFSKKGLTNVVVETAHSLAYHYTVRTLGYRIKANAYTVHEIAQLLQLSANSDAQTAYIIASHVQKFIAYFCNSTVAKVQDLNYKDVVADPKALAFVELHYAPIEQLTRLFLSKMNSGTIEITHDFYLKKFQLSQPKLPYDYILFDEGQDASPAMLDVFLKQPCIKVIAGDTHQQIYGWRYALNSLEKVHFESYPLSTSFRFGKAIANLAIEVLNWKHYLGNQPNMVIKGNGHHDAIKVKAIIARTNLGLLLKAIEQVSTMSASSKIYFEGNIHSYTYADDGTSLYDVLNLYNGKHDLIKDPMLKSLNKIVDLENYIEKTEDATLSMLVEVVKKYGNDIPGILKKLKDKHVADKEKAAFIFSTVHRCKGLEYDTVQLANDFITEEKIAQLSSDVGLSPLTIARLQEEINVLYVAITRTRNRLYIAEHLLPDTIMPSLHIQVLKSAPAEPDKKYRHPKAPPLNDTAVVKKGRPKKQWRSDLY
jgi:superfamily I DNA/RNA helicase